MEGAPNQERGTRPVTRLPASELRSRRAVGCHRRPARAPNHVGAVSDMDADNLGPPQSGIAGTSDQVEAPVASSKIGQQRPRSADGAGLLGTSKKGGAVTAK